MASGITTGSQRNPAIQKLASHAIDKSLAVVEDLSAVPPLRSRSMEPFARTIDAAKKYVVSSTLERVDWNAELVRGDLREVVQQLKQERGKGLFVGGVRLPMALAGWDQSMNTSSWFTQDSGPRTGLFAGPSKRLDLKLVTRLEFASGAVSMRYEPTP